jgi:hypothetical protein
VVLLQLLEQLQKYNHPQRREGLMGDYRKGLVVQQVAPVMLETFCHTNVPFFPKQETAALLAVFQHYEIKKKHSEHVLQTYSEETLSILDALNTHLTPQRLNFLMNTEGFDTLVKLQRALTYVAQKRELVWPFFAPTIIENIAKLQLNEHFVKLIDGLLIPVRKEYYVPMLKDLLANMAHDLSALQTLSVSAGGMLLRAAGVIGCAVPLLRSLHQRTLPVFSLSALAALAGEYLWTQHSNRIQYDAYQLMQEAPTGTLEQNVSFDTGVRAQLSWLPMWHQLNNPIVSQEPTHFYAGVATARIGGAECQRLEQRLKGG